MSSIGKEMFMRAHEQLIEEYLDAHPTAKESDAYEKTADAAFNAMREMAAEIVDHAKMLAKDKGSPPAKTEALEQLLVRTEPPPHGLG